MDTIQARNMQDRVNRYEDARKVREMSTNTRVRSGVLRARIHALHRRHEAVYQARDQAACR